MVKRLLALSLLLVGMVAVMGCHMPLKGVAWALVVDTKSPLEIGDTTVGMSKTGVSEWRGILLLADGDASLSTAMKNGGITKIHHVDLETLSILGIYTKQKVIVYGE